MKPMIVLPPDTMKPEDIAMLRENGLCVVEATEPSRVKFMDPISAVADRPQIEQAAIALSRKLLNRQWGQYSATGQLGHSEFSRMFVDLILQGTPLSAHYLTDSEIREEARQDEIRKMAREEARAERAAAKAAKQQGKKS